MAQVIDYEELVAGYWDRLTTILRGFRAAEGCEFLEAWVPDDDDYLSIAGIVEAAKQAGLPGITLSLGAATAHKLDQIRLEATLARYGTISLGRRGPDDESIRAEVSF